MAKRSAERQPSGNQQTASVPATVVSVAVASENTVPANILAATPHISVPPPSSFDPLPPWLADYLIETVEPNMIELLLRRCAEKLGLDQARRIAKRFGVVRPKLAGVAKIGLDKAEARVRAIAAMKETEERKRQEAERDEQEPAETLEPVVA